ncbi:MAG TPA: hypothetical protein DDX91_02840 [Ruminococcaceae bacterium]|nr:hypothetical protein [Oscillospiraceae bacterium]
MKRRPKNPAFDELKTMLPTALIVNGLILVGAALYGIFEGVTWRAFAGMIYGNLLCAGNFILIGSTAVSTVSGASEKKGRFFANMSYGLRYVGLFICLGGALWLNLIDLIPAFAPLFIPKIHYTLKYVLAGKNPPDLNNF